MFAKWEVKGIEYKLRLDTEAVQDLEEKLGTSLLNVLNAGVPTLKTMLDIAFYAMKKYNSGITRKDLNNIFDSYIEEGGSQLDFFTKIMMNIFKVSGFFSKSQQDLMEEKQTEIQEMLG